MLDPRQICGLIVAAESDSAVTGQAYRGTVRVRSSVVSNGRYTAVQLPIDANPQGPLPFNVYAVTQCVPPESPFSGTALNTGADPFADGRSGPIIDRSSLAYTARINTGESIGNRLGGVI